MRVADSGRNPLYEGLFDGETEEQRHQRIDAARVAEIERLKRQVASLRQHKNDYMEAAEETQRALHHEIAQVTGERDAALSRLAEMERQVPAYTKPSWTDNYGWSGGYIDFKCAPDVGRLARHFEDLLDAVPEGPLYAAPVAKAGQVPELLEWAVGRWHAEVSQRPLVNVHRRALDDTWRQVIRRLGGDAGLLCGPAHDELLAAAPQPEKGDK